MALNSANVLVASTGAVRVAPLGTVAPTDADAVFGAGWIDLGYISEDGLTEAHDDSITEIPAWQNGAIVRTLFTGSTMTREFTVIETTAAAVSLYYKGSDLSGVADGPATLEIKAPTADRRSFAFDVIDGDRLIRTIYPIAEVTERGEISYKSDELIGYPFTVSAYQDGDGTLAFQYYSETLPGLPAGP